MPLNARYMEGDVLAFRTKGLLSSLIRIINPWAFFKKRGINHVGIFATNPETKVVEVFSADLKGARFLPLERAVAKAKGKVGILHLNPNTLKRFNLEGFNAKVKELIGKPYDVLGFIGVGIDDEHIDAFGYIPGVSAKMISWAKRVFKNKEDINKVVCSGVVTWAHIGAGILDDDLVNASEATPLDVCRRQRYENQIDTIVGKNMRINKFNTVGYAFPSLGDE